MEDCSKHFSQQYNQLIIDLIHNKLAPLQKSRKLKMLPEVVNHSKSSGIHFKQANVSFPSLPSTKLTILQSNKQNHQGNLLERVKQYLQIKRKQNHNSGERTYLQPYIEIFQRPIENLGRIKRHSIQLNFAQVQCHQRVINNRQGIGFLQKEFNLNQQECSVFNAKIRRKLNHKKLVDLHRRN